MIRTTLFLSIVLTTCIFTTRLPAAENEPSPIKVSAADWPWWRGPNRNGIAAEGQHPPLHWSETENILWKTSLPGRGHSSPTVVGSRIYLTSADEQQEIQYVLCYDRQTGKEIWRTAVHRGGFGQKGNKKRSQASSSVACDGERLFVNFLNDGAVYTTALSLAGKQLWRQKVTDYVTHQGYGSSPALYESLVIVSADNKGGGAIVGFNRATGDVVWKRKRPEMPNYASPVIFHLAGRDQLLFSGCEVVSSFDPLTGKTLWEVEGATTECVTTMVTDGVRVFTTGGYPKNHVAAMRADGSGKVAWENTVRTYVPSLLVKDGYLYAVTDAGVAVCWKSDTGEELWKKRLGGVFTSSPVLVGDQIFATNEGGKTFVFAANPQAFQLISKNQLGEQVYATPTFCDSRIYMRVADGAGTDRRETLYCIGVE